MFDIWDTLRCELKCFLTKCFSFKNILARDQDIYFWNPCVPFTYLPEIHESVCVNVAMCMERLAVPQNLIYALGTQHSAKFTTDSNGTVHLSYIANLGDYMQLTDIELKCSHTSELDLLFADVEKNLGKKTTAHRLLLVSKHACGYMPTQTASCRSLSTSRSRSNSTIRQSTVSPSSTLSPCSGKSRSIGWKAPILIHGYTFVCSISLLLVKWF